MKNPLFFILLLLVLPVFLNAQIEDTPPPPPPPPPRPAIQTNPPNNVYSKVDQAPRFPGCEAIPNEINRKKCTDIEMLKFIYGNLKYPTEARENGIEGMVVVICHVEKDGTLTNIKISKALGGGCDEEAKRVVELMPNWIPGKQAGEVVVVKRHIPFKFKLE